MDQGQLDALYQQYLGRGVDPSGAATWGNADYNTVVQGILGSQEYQNRQGSSQPAPQAQSGGGGNDINSIYQQYLGRGVDPSGAATYAGWDPQSIINAITSSQEYANRGGSGAGQSAPTAQEPPPDWLRPEDYFANGYAAPYTAQQISQQVDPSWYRPASGGVTYASLKGPSDLSGGEYVIDTRTGTFARDQNGNPIPVPRPNDPNSFNSSFADTWIPAGIALMAAGTGLGAAGLIGEGAAAGTALGAESAGQALPYTEAFDAANLYSNGITNAGQLGDILTSTGMDPFLAADMGNLAAQGLSAEQIAQVLGYSYNAAELAGTGIQSFLPEAASAASSALSGSQIANLAKSGLSLAGLANKLLGGGSSTSGSLTPAQLAKGLGTYNPSTGSNVAQTGSNFGLMKGNVSPFYFGKDVPTQTLATNKADPFAALNVAQTPITPFNPLAHIVG